MLAGRFVIQLWTDLKIVPVRIQINGMFWLRSADDFEKYRATKQLPKWSLPGTKPVSQTKPPPTQTTNLSQTQDVRYYIMTHLHRRLPINSHAIPEIGTIFVCDTTRVDLTTVNNMYGDITGRVEVFCRILSVLLNRRVKNHANIHVCTLDENQCRRRPDNACPHTYIYI